MTPEFISIGPYCVTADYLKITNNRKLAYPFDYVFSSLFMISHCITDEFKTFLNNDYIKYINDSQTTHIIYDNLLNLKLASGIKPVVFNHHNLKNEETYNAYIRRCYRFLNAIKNNNSYLVYTIKNYDVYVNYNLEELIEFSNLVKNTNIIVLYITNEQSYLNINNLHIFKIVDDSYETINNIFLQFK